MAERIFNLEQYAKKAREAAAEGAVLLRNEGGVLPLAAGEKIALFGRSQFNYYKSGTGSGGLVNASYVTGIREALMGSSFVLNQTVMAAYEEWLADHPYDKGVGWAGEPWFQEEMPLTEEFVKAARKESDTAIVIIGRTAGEDQDNKAEAGSYLLTEAEEQMLKTVCGVFERTVVLLNVGNIIDMKWVKAYQPAAVLYVWQGGQEGGNGVLDVLDGTVTPSGKLADTIAWDIEDYPSTKNHGDSTRNVYAEDIYVGYRYFETFAKDKVLYPFGFGLSYTSFALENPKIEEIMPGNVFGRVRAGVRVTNTGKYAGKEVIQVYVQAPQGALGKPARALCGFAKTGLLAPGESQMVTVEFPWRTAASYDDSGAAGYKSSYVLEAGEYGFYVGTDVRSAGLAGSISIERTVALETVEEAMAPMTEFERMKPVVRIGGAVSGEAVSSDKGAVKAGVVTGDAADGAAKAASAAGSASAAADNCIAKAVSAAGSVSAAAQEPQYILTWEKAPLRTAEPSARRKERLPESPACTGDQGWKLADVKAGRVSMETFLAQLENEDLFCMVRGEGMCSPKVTPGTAGAFGGVTKHLQEFGIPVACCADGPSGIRMDCGSIAFAMPNGACLASSFNEALSEELYEWEGLELRKNKIDTLLGPGINLHRNPLNGRNFEYFSEDPLVTGKMAAAQLRGMGRYGVTGTMKHFACNSQEYNRHRVEAVVSERALRELYLKCFEIAVREGGGYSIMTSYNPINGFWSSSNYDMLTTILRKEWGYDGIVMTDWWSTGNDEGELGDVHNVAAMVRGQNDLFMVVNNAEENSQKDNSAKALAAGKVTRGEYLRAAANICRYLMRTPAFARMQGIETELDRDLAAAAAQEEGAVSALIRVALPPAGTTLPVEEISTDKGSRVMFELAAKERGQYRLEFECRVPNQGSLAQVPVTISQDKQIVKMVSLTGEDKEWQKQEVSLNPVFQNTSFVTFFFGQSGMELRDCRVELVESWEEKIKAMMAAREKAE